MGKPSLIIITGPPGAGKTTLARRLADDLDLPLFHKDGIKERLYEALGSGDRTWSRALGRASVDVLLYLAEVELAQGRSIVIESNFWKDLATKSLREIQERQPFRSIQIHLTAEPRALMARFEERDARGGRHAGHADPAALDELREALGENQHAPLEIGGKLWAIDTTNFASIDYELLLSDIKAER